MEAIIKNRTHTLNCGSILVRLGSKLEAVQSATTSKLCMSTSNIPARNGWIECFLVVTFDLELGQSKYITSFSYSLEIELIHPEEYTKQLNETQLSDL